MKNICGQQPWEAEGEGVALLFLGEKKARLSTVHLERPAPGMGGGGGSPKQAERESVADFPPSISSSRQKQTLPKSQDTSWRKEEGT